MTQANIDDGNAQNNRLFYVNSGTYNAGYGSATGFAGESVLQVNNDIIEGRQNYNGNPFVQLAQGDNRPLILFSQGGFLVPGMDSGDTFSSLQLQGNDPDGMTTFSSGILINHDRSRKGRRQQ